VLTLKGLKILHKWLALKIEKFKLEIHNDSTYSYSRGYQKCLKDIKEFIDIEISENK